MPFTRPRSAADIMTRSLLPTLDGLTFGLSKPFAFELKIGESNFNNPISLFLDPTFARAIEGNPMSRSSFASFHLTGIKPSSGKLMTSSVDRLFENDSDVFISSNYNDFNQVRFDQAYSNISTNINILLWHFNWIISILQILPAIQEAASVQSKSPEPPKVHIPFSHSINHSSFMCSREMSNNSLCFELQQNSMISNQQLDSATSNSGGRDSPGTATSTAKSSRRDSLTDKVVIPTQSQLQQKQQATNQVQPQSTQTQVPKATAFEIPANNTNRRFVSPRPWKLYFEQRIRVLCRTNKTSFEIDSIVEPPICWVFKLYVYFKERPQRRE